MSKPVKDFFDQDLAVGDVIVYAALWDRSAVMKVGKITALKDSTDWRGDATLKVQAITVDKNAIDWKNDCSRGWAVQNNGKTITLSFLDRMIKVSPDSLPAHIRALLNV